MAFRGFYTESYHYCGVGAKDLPAKILWYSRFPIAWIKFHAYPVIFAIKLRGYRRQLARQSR